MKSLLARLRRPLTAHGRWTRRFASHPDGYAAVADRSLTDELYLEAIACKTSCAMGVLDAHLGALRDRAILDAGCGYGNVTQALHAAGASAWGVDFVPDAVQRARDLYPDCHFEVADLTDLRLNRTFDAILTIDTLINVVEDRAWRSILDSFARHVDRGGIVLILERMLQPDEHVDTAPHVRFRSAHDYARATTDLGLHLIDHHLLWIEEQNLHEELVVLTKHT